MKREIPPVKAKPESIPYLLKIISDNEGDYKAITKDVYEYLCTITLKKKKPSIKNLVRAVALPTLRHLLLIGGTGNDTSISARGRVLLNKSLSEFDEVSESNFRKSFAEYILKLERRYFIPVSDSSLSLTESLEGQFFDISSLLKHIQDEFGEKATNTDRLRRWLSYLKYVGFIKDTGKAGVYRLHKHQIKAAEISKTEVPDSDFKQKLISEYYELASSYQTLGYVAIPKLRHAVCVSFDGRLWDEDFDRILKKIKKEDETYIIGFAEPMSRKSGGLHLNGRYYYYVVIRKKERAR